MNRLQSELNRLYLIASPADAALDVPPPSLVDPQGGVRAIVMELAQPPDWEVLSVVWRGVQSELELPAPAIAVSGLDGLQLWFSLAEPIAAARAHAFLDALRVRFLPEIRASRVRLLPAPDATTRPSMPHAELVPAEQKLTGNWSAFVAPDLAAVFSETPWLEMAPNEEGQASLLRGLQTMARASFDAAVARLAADAAPPVATATSPVIGQADATPAPTAQAQAVSDPKRFLVGIMNDETVALALRIEAAKALLPYAGAPASPRDA